MKHYAPLSLMQSLSNGLFGNKDKNSDALSLIAIRSTGSTYRHWADKQFTPTNKEYLRQVGCNPRVLRESEHFEYLEAKPGKYSAGVKFIVPNGIDIKAVASGEVDIKTGKRRSTPRSAIQSRDTNGNNAVYRNSDISVTTPIDIPALELLRDDIAESYQVRMAASSLISSSVDGYKTQTFVESGAGRLYALGGGIQNAPKTVRRAALNGTELDFVNCHPTILMELAERYQVELSALKRYASNPTEVREELADTLGIAVAGAKVLLLAATFFGHRRYALSEIVSRHGGDPEQLRDVDYLKQYQRDIRKITKVLVERSPKSRNGALLINVLGKSIQTNEKQSRLLAHIIQGYEASALHTLIEGLEVLCLEHDGATVADRNLDLEEVSDRVSKATGIRLKVEEKG